MQFMLFLKEVNQICGLAALRFRMSVKLFPNPYRLSQKVVNLSTYVLYLIGVLEDNWDIQGTDWPYGSAFVHVWTGRLAFFV